MTGAENQICQNCKASFTIDASDFDFYKKIDVPSPTWCPECRMMRRFTFRNDKNLFRRKDDATGKEMFSGFPASMPAKVYDLEYWNSDAWDPMAFGREYDFSRPFFEQFRDVFYAVPWPAKSVQRMINSEYCDQAGDFKNCYLCFNGNALENSAYMRGCYFTKDSLDSFESDHSELCYGNYMTDECNRAFFSMNCESSHNIWFSKDLIGCSDCFGCVNLRNKSYYIFNEPYTKEDYKAYLAKFDLGSRRTIDELLAKAHGFWMQFPVRFTLGFRNANSTGEHVQESRNVNDSYCVHGGENLKYSQFAQGPAADSYDYTVWGDRVSMMYETLTCGEECYGLKFCWECWPGSNDLEYCAFCRSSSDLFGCVGLKKKQYCIFNKQYTKDEYFALREKIIAQMNELPYVSEVRSQNSEVRKIEYRYGEFFPSEFSPFAYNETIAQDFFKLTKEEVGKKGYIWREPEAREYETTVKAANLPENIKDAQDSVLKEIIECTSCKRAYRVIQMELDFYRRITLPLPRLCLNCRFDERFRFVNPPKLWKGKCQCAGTQSAKRESQIEYKNVAEHFHGTGSCPNEFQTSFAPGRPEIIYCEDCYKNEVA